jgi:hypothetical protein
MTSAFNSQKFNISRFNISMEHAGVPYEYVASDISTKWKNISYSADVLANLIYNNDSYIDVASIFQWNSQINTDEFSDILKWVNREYIDILDISKWNEVAYITPITSFDWQQHFYWRDLRFNQEKYNKSSFNRGTFFVTAGEILKWKNYSFTLQDSVLKWNNRMFTSDLSSILRWNNISYNTIFDVIKWNNREFVSISDIIKWNNRIFSSEYSSIIKWNNRVFTNEYTFDAPWDEVSYNTSTGIVKWNDVAYNVSDGILKWNNVSYDTSSGILKWNNREFAGEYVSDIKWLNRMFISQDSIIKWNNRVFMSEISDIVKWNNVNYNTSSSILKWINQTFIDSLSTARWGEIAYNTGQSIFVWLNSSGGLFPLTDYLSVKTIQGKYIFPDIIGGNLSFKDGSIGEAVLELSQFIPEDSRCIFYLKGDARMFDGVSRRCVKDGNSGTYKVTIQEYNEILKPENGKGGYYLVKSDWHDVELHNLLSSNKPSLNNNEVGLLYMACSAIPDYLFEECDITNNIFKFEYTGLPYSITEVFEDSTLLTQKTSTTALITASGWYHDVTNKTLYVKCTDGVFPYYHVISVPYIWDFKVPIRIGNISSQASTVIAYWETANGDIPADTIETLLTALNLEYEPVYRNGVCHIDVSAKIGSGTTTSPANYYNEQDNIIAVQEIDMADARNMINGVGFRGYGSGAGGVISGKHINTGRGGRFILLDDSSVHSQAMADGFVQKYLDDHYLPARSIKFSAPLFIGGAVDQRRLGDTAHISIPSEYLEQDLRVKEVAIKLKPLSQTLTFGDKLISYDDQLKAMRSASEKYRKHLQGEVEEFTWNWTENIDNGANRSNKFTITADALKIQKLELSCSTDLFRTDAVQGGSDGGGGGGAGDGGGESGEKPHTGPGDAHTHTLTSGSVGVPSATIAVAAKDHYHVLSALLSSVPSATVAVAASAHYHVLNALVSNTPSTTVVVAASSHYHVLNALVSSTPSATISVAVYGHVHQFTVTSVATTSFTSVAVASHTHTYTSGGPSALTTVVTGVTSSTVTPNTGCCTAVGCGKAFLVSVTVGAASTTSTSVASNGHTHSGTTSVESSSISVPSGAHTHVVSGTAVATTSSSVSVALGTHTHTTSGNTDVCNAQTTVSTSTHTHATSGNTDVCNAQTTVSTSTHTHTTSGNTDTCNAQTNTATYNHTHVITALVLATEATHTHEISSDGYNPTLATEEDVEICVDPTTKEPPADWSTNPDKRQKAADMYTFISSPSYPAHSPIDPTMRFKVAISGPGITGSVEISGSPLVIHVEDSFGPILIDNLVKSAGEYTVTVGLTNVDYHADKTHIRFSMQVNGIIFCDTIIKS